MAWNSELNVFKKIKFVGEIFDRLPNILLGTNVYKIPQSCWQSLLIIPQWADTTSVISKWSTFWPFSFSVILFSVLPSNYIVSGVKSLR